MRASEDLDLLLALGTPLLLSLVAAYLLSLRLRVLLQALAVLLSPVGFYVLGEGLRELGALGADPDQAFSQSWGQFGVVRRRACGVHRLGGRTRRRSYPRGRSAWESMTRARSNQPVPRLPEP